ncbi:MAG: biotin--[acetyl-CoA-carboxylase] ligase [Micrococcales bacterium]|nr:biotin--[acetyl-CoA-carboxylase] ligase [Micrococcales bacterium]
MEFPLSAELAARVVALDETDSTNDDLVALATAGAVPEFTVVVTTRQTAGRGRLGRAWVAPPGTSLAASVLLHPRDAGVPLERYGWIPLVAGLAMTRAVRRLAPDRRVELKWPNDVHIDGRKVCGVLSELLPDGQSVVVGAGLNLTIPVQALPVLTATSLSLNGVAGSAEVLADRALAGYLGELRRLWAAFTADGSGEAADGIRTAVSEACSTLRQEVRVDLPDGTRLTGTAIDLDEAGRLRISIGSNGSLQTVAAGDITHLRYE